MLIADYETSIEGRVYTLTTNKDLMNTTEIHRWLNEEAYWALKMDYEKFLSAFHHSFCIGILHTGHQIGFGRLATDYATYAYLMDVYVEAPHREKGLGKLMMDQLLGLDWVKGLRRINLRTKDAQWMYGPYGFNPPKFPERFMGRASMAEDPFAWQTKNEIIHHTSVIGGKEYLVTSQKDLMKRDQIHKWLTEEAYWCKGIPFDTFNRGFENSYCIGILHGNRQIAYARIITDYTVHGYLADVYVLEEYRGMGLSIAMLQPLLNLSWAKNISLNLVTKGGQGLYAKFGFVTCNPERIMELVRPDIYG